MVENGDAQGEDLGRLWQKTSLLASLQPKPISVEKAGFWRRFIAYSIDWFILGIIGRFFASLVGDEGTSFWGVIILFILGILVPAAYFIWPYSRGGQTLGKRFLGLRVVSIDGSPLTWRKGITRTLGYIPSTVVFYMGFLWATWDSDKQAWQDKMAGTLVLPASIPSQMLQGYIEPAEGRRRQRKWELGLGIPTISILFVGAIAYTLFVMSGLSEVKEMGDWPNAEASPEDVVDVDLSYLGLELSRKMDPQMEGTWEGGKYDKGVLVSFESGGKDIVYIWALGYVDTRDAENDFNLATAWAEQNCALYTWRNVAGSGIINCSYADAYDRVLRNQNWILNIVAVGGSGSNPEYMVNRVLASISTHWGKSLKLRDTDSFES